MKVRKQKKEAKKRQALIIKQNQRFKEAIREPRFYHFKAMNYLYHNICLRITIADKIQFAKCSSIRIEQSVEVLSNTAKIELPREFRNAIDVKGSDGIIRQNTIGYNLS